MADVCMKEKHVEDNGEIVSTCCEECMRNRRRTPCTPCIDSGTQTGWKDSYVRHASQSAADAVERKRDFGIPVADFEGAGES